MKLNPMLEEKPDHGHYAACLSRKEEIDKYCNRAFIYTIVASLVLAFFTLCTIELPLLSFVPKLVGDVWDPFPIFIQIIELIGIAILAAAACTRKKVLLVALMIYYLSLIAASLISGSFPGIMATFLLGIGGAAVTIKAPAYYRDYEQLTKTEGWPHFARWMTDAAKRPAYSYDEYRKRAAEKAAMEDKMASGRSYTAPRKSTSSDYEAAKMADEVMRAAEAEARERKSFDPYEARRLAAEEARRAADIIMGGAEAAPSRSMPSFDDMPGIGGATAAPGAPEPAMLSGEYTDGFEPM